MRGKRRKNFRSCGKFRGLFYANCVRVARKSYMLMPVALISRSEYGKDTCMFTFKFDKFFIKFSFFKNHLKKEGKVTNGCNSLFLQKKPDFSGISDAPAPAQQKKLCSPGTVNFSI